MEGLALVLKKKVLSLFNSSELTLVFFIAAVHDDRLRRGEVSLLLLGSFSFFTSLTRNMSLKEGCRRFILVRTSVVRGRVFVIVFFHTKLSSC